MDIQSEFVLSQRGPAPVVESSERIQLIFDAETLLLDPLPGVIDSVGWALIEQGMAPTVAQMENAGVGRRPISHVLSALMDTQDTQTVATATSRFHSYFNNSGRFRCSLREGALSLIQTLASDPRFELHYLTHIGTRDTQKLLEHYGLGHVPMSVTTLEHATCPGIRLPMMKFMVEQTAKASRNWVLLSDHPWELMAAHQIGIRSIGLAYGRSDLSSLCALEPDAIAAAPTEMMNLLKSLLPASIAPLALLKSRAVH